MRKFTWGTGILITMISFIAFILFLAIYLMNTKVDMDQEDYYAKDLQFQQEIDAIDAGNKMNLISALKKTDDMVILQLPSDRVSDVVIRFKRSNDNRLDKEFVLEQTSTLTVPLATLAKGRYQVELEYMANQRRCLEKIELEL